MIRQIKRIIAELLVDMAIMNVKGAKRLLGKNDKLR